MNKSRKTHPVAALRHLARMAGRDFASLVGISYPRLVAIESGRLQLPRETGLRIAALFGVDELSLSDEGGLRAWDGLPLTTSKIEEYKSSPHDVQRLKESWTRPMDIRLIALLDAAAVDPQKSRIVLAEFTSWIEGIRESLNLVDQTEAALSAAGAPVSKRHWTTTVGELRNYFRNQEAAEESSTQRLSDQWRRIEKSAWKDTASATLVEDIKPLWSPLFDPSSGRGKIPPVDCPVWKFSRDWHIFVEGDFAGIISSCHTLAVDEPVSRLGWVEPTPQAPDPPKRTRHGRKVGRALAEDPD